MRGTPTTAGSKMLEGYVSPYSGNFDYPPQAA
ncbi:MAG: hypothetical protein ACKPKO_18025 [Candidatus Fonsibacter sp.]